MRISCSRFAGQAINECCRWKTLRGSQPIQLNSSLSLMQSYGSDVGGFAGPLPSPELFTRWVQLGVTHSRFCIHSYKPNKNDPSGAADTNTPWMVGDIMKVRYIDVDDAVPRGFTHYSSNHKVAI